MDKIKEFLESKKKKKEVIEFYKRAFCVDGEVKVTRTIKNFKILGVVELNDSKRGRFYIGRLKKETKPLRGG